MSTDELNIDPRHLLEMNMEQFGDWCVAHECSPDPMGSPAATLWAGWIEAGKVLMSNDALTEEEFMNICFKYFKAMGYANVH